MLWRFGKHELANSLVCRVSRKGESEIDAKHWQAKACPTSGTFSDTRLDVAGLPAQIPGASNGGGDRGAHYGVHGAHGRPQGRPAARPRLSRYRGAHVAVDHAAVQRVFAASPRLGPEGRGPDSELDGAARGAPDTENHLAFRLGQR